MKTNLRRIIAATLVTFASLLLVMGLEPVKPSRQGGLRLAFEKLTRPAKTKSGRQTANPSLNPPSPSNAPTFGHPIIAGIGGTGFEESIRIDPTNPDRIYTSAPGSLSADTSWVWHSLDGGRTFKWVVGAAPLE